MSLQKITYGYTHRSTFLAQEVNDAVTKINAKTCRIQLVFRHPLNYFKMYNLLASEPCISPTPHPSPQPPIQCWEGKGR